LFKRKPIVLLLTVLVMSLFLAGCGTVRIVSDECTLDGHPARNVIVILEEPYETEWRFMPAGTYTPCLEDDNGVYYQSPSPTRFGLGHFWPYCGIFFKGGDSKSPYHYWFGGAGGRFPAKSKLPENFAVRIERSREIQIRD